MVSFLLLQFLRHALLFSQQVTQVKVYLDIHSGSPPAKALKWSTPYC